ncbi:unnamed protein product [Allacma fusca]|uniref:Neurotransmitter-gated ion-channel transmembrane domain-containing protein n=1 Tax=Allacma fusca TaxID=39272 RepID=A0A8J2KW57_9HEXA|nr:unnamed protein product [Allacma fusca]
MIPCRYFLPREERFRTRSTSVGRIRQKSWLIPVTHREPRSGSLKRSHVQLPPDRTASGSYVSHQNVVTLSTTTSSGVRGEGDHHLGALEGMGVIIEPLSEFSSTESVTNESPGNFSKSARSSTVAINYHQNLSSHHHANTTTATAHHRHPNKSLKAPSQVDTAKDVQSVGDISGGSLPPPVVDVQEELLRSIRTLIVKQEEVEAQNLLVAEWRLVAQAIDKILFWIFFTVTLVSSAVFLLILPCYKRSFYGPNKPPPPPTE